MCPLAEFFILCNTWDYVFLKSEDTKVLIFFPIKKMQKARHWWLMSVILATQEAEIRRIPKSKSAQGNSLWDPISEKKTITKDGWWSGLRYRPWVQAPVLEKKMQESVCSN
jgi:hypothetical protein